MVAGGRGEEVGAVAGEEGAVGTKGSVGVRYCEPRCDSLADSDAFILSAMILIVLSRSFRAASSEVILAWARFTSLVRNSILAESAEVAGAGALDFLAGGGLTVLGTVPVSPCCEVVVLGCEVPKVGCEVLKVGCEVPKVGCEVPNWGMLVAGSAMLVAMMVAGVERVGMVSSSSLI